MAITTDTIAPGDTEATSRCRCASTTSSPIWPTRTGRPTPSAPYCGDLLAFPEHYDGDFATIGVEPVRAFLSEWSGARYLNHHRIFGTA
jgi:hypothetical protein